MALRGLWGSVFSGKGGFMRNPRRFWSKIDVVAGVPPAAEAVTGESLAQRVLELRGERR